MSLLSVRPRIFFPWTTSFDSRGCLLSGGPRTLRSRLKASLPVSPVRELVGTVGKKLYGIASFYLWRRKGPELESPGPAKIRSGVRASTGEEQRETQLPVEPPSGV